MLLIEYFMEKKNEMLSLLKQSEILLIVYLLGKPEKFAETI